MPSSGPSRRRRKWAWPRDGLPPPGPALPQDPMLSLAGQESGEPAATRHDAGNRQAVPDPWQHQEAVAACTEAMRFDPDHPHAWLERRDLKGRQGQYEGAIADYDRAIRLDPDVTSALGDE